MKAKPEERSDHKRVDAFCCRSCVLFPVVIIERNNEVRQIKAY